MKKISRIATAFALSAAAVLTPAVAFAAPAEAPAAVATVTAPVTTPMSVGTYLPKCQGTWRVSTRNGKTLMPSVVGMHPGNKVNIRCYLDVNWGSFPHAPTTNLQVTLKNTYKEDIATDGYYGWGTYHAMVRTQQRIGVPADGEYGPYTGVRMEWFNIDGKTSGRLR